MNVLLTAEWRNLLFLNYVVEQRVLEPFLPAGTELDTWGGQPYVSVVAYQFKGVRVGGLPVPGHQDFEGLNLRFYVKHDAGGQVRHGVVFLSQIAPRAVMAAMTRAVFNEPYEARAMRSVIDAGPPLRVAYSWRSDTSWQHCSAVATGPADTPKPSTLEGFLTERHWSYTRQTDGTTLEYRVDHSPWRVYPTEAVQVVADFAKLYGKDLGAMLKEKPTASLFISEGSPVRVYWPKRLAVAGDAKEPWRGGVKRRTPRTA